MLGLGSQRLADGAAGLDDSKTMLSAVLKIPMLVPQPGREPDVPSPGACIKDVDGASPRNASPVGKMGLSAPTGVARKSLNQHSSTDSIHGDRVGAHAAFR